MTRALTLACAVALLAPSAAFGQNSVYGVRGIGFPGHPTSVRSRSLAGGWSMFDNFSSVNPATTASFANLSVSAIYGTTVRNYSIDTTSVSGLVETRFPHAILGGNLPGTPLSVSFSISTYAERSFDVTTSGSGIILGETVQIEDRFASDGGIVDSRAAIGWRVTNGFQIGAGVHLINGSSKLSAQREFVDTDLVTFDIDSDVSFSGMGLSTGMLWRSPGSRVQLSASGRWDSKLATVIDEQPETRIDLPVSVSGGVSFMLTNLLRWSTSATWRQWSVSTGEVAAGNTVAPVQAFDTWQVGSGFEIANLETRFPLRLGVRYATLPFAVAAQPDEFVLTAGTGSRFAAGRGRLDVVVERLMRQGAGATERGWHFAVGITVTP